jgi:hypothetical protein
MEKRRDEMRIMAECDIYRERRKEGRRWNAGGIHFNVFPQCIILFTEAKTARGAPQRGSKQTEHSACSVATAAYLHTAPKHK